MQDFSPITRIASGLVLLTVSLIMLLDMVGFLPAPADDTVERRLAICEQLALSAAKSATQNDLASIRSDLRAAVRRHEYLMSAALRGHNGQLLVSVGDHDVLWQPPKEDHSSLSHIQIPLKRQGRDWATLETRFKSDGRGWLQHLLDRPTVRLLGALSLLAFFSYLFYLRHALKHLDPSSVIPSRVQTALDVMAEGVLLVDDKERIVLANNAASEKLGESATSLMGRRISDLPWKPGPGQSVIESLPWSEAMRESQMCTGAELSMVVDNERRLFVVNGSPVLDGWGSPKGAIVTLDDVTELEKQKEELGKALEELEKSRDEIRLQNEELQVMASTDPLTGISNRRDFMRRIEEQFAEAKADGSEFCVVMADIDHFKNVNDNHGHAAGDEVIRTVAQALSAEVGSSQLACRYGGEEFALLLDGASLDLAWEMAERIRRRIEAPGFVRMPISASFGVASIRSDVSEASALIDLADAALYASKNEGRNRVTKFEPERHAELISSNRL